MLCYLGSDGGVIRMTKLEEACDAITDYVLMEALTANVNPAELYVSDDILVTDSYFSLAFCNWRRNGHGC